MPHRIKLIAIFIVCVTSLTACQVQRETYGDLIQLMEQSFSPTGPGVVLVINNPRVDEQVLTIGQRDLDKGRRIQSINHLRIGDITKTFVSTLVFQLVSEGKIALDDTLDQHFSAEILAGIPHTDTITIRQLLNMSSGLYDYRRDPDYLAAVAAEPFAAWTPVELLQFVAGREPVQAPGTRYAYSNTNYMLLHILVETKFDDLLANLLRERILDILLMDDTYLEISEDIAIGYIPGYVRADGETAYTNTLDLGDARGLGDMGLIANALNLVEFAPALYARTLMGADGRAQSLATIPMDSGDAYGLGIMRRDSPWGEMWGHDNEQPGFAGQMWYLPDHETSIVVLSNGIEKDVLAAFVMDALRVVIGDQ